MDTASRDLPDRGGTSEGTRAGQEILSCDEQTGRGSVWTNLKVENSGESGYPVIGNPPNTVRFTSRSSSRFPQ